MIGYEFERWRFRMDLTREDAAKMLCISYKEVCVLEAMDKLPECYRRALRYFEEERRPSMGPMTLPQPEKISHH